MSATHQQVNKRNSNARLTPAAATTLIAWLTAELDRALSSKPTHNEKIALLAYCDRRWQDRYARFVATQGDSEQPHPTYGMPTATDFVLIIGEIAKRKASLKQGEMV